MFPVAPWKRLRKSERWFQALCLELFREVGVELSQSARLPTTPIHATSSVHQKGPTPSSDRPSWSRLPDNGKSDTAEIELLALQRNLPQPASQRSTGFTAHRGRLGTVGISSAAATSPGWQQTTPQSAKKLLGRFPTIRAADGVERALSTGAIVGKPAVEEVGQEGVRRVVGHCNRCAHGAGSFPQMRESGRPTCTPPTAGPSLLSAKAGAYCREGAVMLWHQAETPTSSRTAIACYRQWMMVVCQTRDERRRVACTPRMLALNALPVCHRSGFPASGAVSIGRPGGSDRRGPVGATVLRNRVPLPSMGVNDSEQQVDRWLLEWRNARMRGAPGPRQKKLTAYSVPTCIERSLATECSVRRMQGRSKLC